MTDPCLLSILSIPQTSPHYLCACLANCWSSPPTWMSHGCFNATSWKLTYVSPVSLCKTHPIINVPLTAHCLQNIPKIPLGYSKSSSQALTYTICALPVCPPSGPHQAIPPSFNNLFSQNRACGWMNVEWTLLDMLSFHVHSLLFCLKCPFFSLCASSMPCIVQGTTWVPSHCQESLSVDHCV